MHKQNELSSSENATFFSKPISQIEKKEGQLNIQTPLKLNVKVGKK